MVRFLSMLFLFLAGLIAMAQPAQNVFDWKEGAVVTKHQYFPLVRNNSYTKPVDSDVYNPYVYTLKSQNGDAYVVKLHTLDEARLKSENAYDGFSLFYKGCSILSYYTGDRLFNCSYITLEKDKSRFLQIPLDAKSFALCFGGWLYGDEYSPELVIVVVSDGKAKIVFDNYAYAYKYTPSPNFAIEYIADITGLYEQREPIIRPSFLKSRTKHKIWREGNVLKYKSWK